MAKTSKRTTKQLVKKKIWVKIISPKFLGEKEIGESYIEELSNSIGKQVSINLMKITGDIKTQGSTVKFEINEVKDDLLRTRIVSYSYLPSSIKRLVRRKMNRIDDSLVIMTKDNRKIRIKPMLLTHGKISKSVEYSLRAAAKKEIIDFVQKTNYEELFSNIIKNKIQKDLKNLLKPIHPLRAAIIRELKEETHHASKISELPKGKKLVSKKQAKKSSEEKKPKAEKKEHKEVDESDMIEEEMLAEKEDTGKKSAKKSAKAEKTEKPAKSKE